MSKPEYPLREDKFEKAKRHFLLGLESFERQHYEEAENQFRLSLEFIPDRLSTLTNLTATLIRLKKLPQAETLVSKILRLFPNDAIAHLNEGNLLKINEKFSEAIASYDRAISLSPENAEVHANRGTALKELNRLGEALESFNEAIRLNPDCEYLPGNRLHTKMMLCEWSNIQSEIDKLISAINEDKKVSPSFPVMALTDCPITQCKASEIWIKDQSPFNPSLGPVTLSPRKQKIRVGYYSADFHNHATAYLMAELFECHDKNNFELFGFSFGPDKQDEMRQRVSNAFSQFIDVRHLRDADIASLSRDLAIDIAIDLKGLTQGAREGIFSYRAAPIQVSFIGYPGTMASEYIDYLVADPILIPAENQKYYSEKIIYLPDSYQVNDRQRIISDKRITREELGIPAEAFVFCCFNNNYKITPATFDSWARILNAVEHSVLWLLEDNQTAAKNLQKEATARGIRADRLLFAKRTTLPEHLARHKAADLFLDTLPYNAHTTASDALWAGLPVLTCMGKSFPGRVAASLLNALELPELITSTRENFENTAISLARNPEKLKAIQDKLQRNRLNTALFDTPRFTRNIESAYTQIYERCHAGLPPDHIYVGSQLNTPPLS